MLKPGQLFPGEREAVEEVKRLGSIYGYGNLISHLKEAWRVHLIASGLDPATAAHHTKDWGDPAPTTTRKDG